MKISKTRVAGVCEIQPTVSEDERGVFARTYDAEIFANFALPTHWPHNNASWNRTRGTLRGMHYQAMHAPEPKLVRCTKGSIFDVAIDVRAGSPTFRSWAGVILRSQSRNSLFIPAGVAHGFLSLEDDTEVFYKMGAIYDQSAGRGVRWNDAAFAVEWPFPPTTVSARDAAYPDFES